VIGKCKMAVLLGGAALLAGCASDEPYSYYNPPVYRVPRVRPKRVYPAPRPPVVNPDDDSAPEGSSGQPSPEPDNSPDVAQRAPDPPAPIRPPLPPPPASLPPASDKYDCTGWWRICAWDSL
jgi:hypothetical protein